MAASRPGPPATADRRGWRPTARLRPGTLALLLGLGSLIATATAAAATAAQRFPRSPAAAYGYAEIHPAWLQGGFWRGRPWPAGWYRATPRAWAQEGMVSPPLIIAAVNRALIEQSAAISVPNTGLQLNYASVEALPNSRIVFFYGDGSSSRRGVGECQLGLLNGRAAGGEEALVLNAACSVAYGRGA